MRNKDLAKIHIAKKDLGLDDDEYRDILWTICRVRSSAELDFAGREKLLKHFRSRGFRAKRKVGPKSTGRMVDKIRAIWITMHKAGVIRDGSEQALSKYVKRMTAKANKGIGIANIEWLDKDPKLATLVLENLKRWQSRVLKTQKA